MLAIRIVQLVLSLVVLALSGYVASWYNVDTLTSSPSQVNFLIFAGLWSVLTLAYLEIVPRFAPRASQPCGALAAEFSNMIFWFAGFVALVVFLSKLLFCRGTVCAAAQADTALAAFLFITWASSASLKAKDMFKGGFRKPTAAGLAGPPAMKETMA